MYYCLLFMFQISKGRQNFPASNTKLSQNKLLTILNSLTVEYCSKVNTRLKQVVAYISNLQLPCNNLLQSLNAQEYTTYFPSLGPILDLTSNYKIDFKHTCFKQVYILFTSTVHYSK